MSCLGVIREFAEGCDGSRGTLEVEIPVEGGIGGDERRVRVGYD